MSESFRDEEGWLAVMGNRDRGLEERLRTQVAGRIEAGEYTPNDLHGVGELHHLGGSLSPTALNQVRRLCQLWEIDLKPTQKITSHRKVIGPLIVFAKRLAFPVVRFFMRDTLKQQRDFNAAVLEAVARLAAEAEKGAGSPRSGTPENQSVARR